MAVAVSGGVTHIPFGQAERYGSPYPEGIAAGLVTAPGDATGGTVQLIFNANGGFLYRLELLHAVRGDTTTDAVVFQSTHDWANQATPVASGGFNLSWRLVNLLATTFAVASMTNSDWDQVRRFPMGSTRDVALQALALFEWPTNTDTTVYTARMVLSYWRKEALHRQGFLQSFWEGPVVRGPGGAP